VEVQLIQVTNLKMQMIQFDSIVKGIQMKVMKVIYIHENMVIQEVQYPMKLKDLMMMKSFESIDDQ
jgi:hypothetical protein